MSLFVKDIGVDFGTTKTIIYLKDKGIVFSEPTVVAMNELTGEVMAVGNEAKEIIGRTPEHISAIRPIKSGVVSNFNAAEKLLKKCIDEVTGKTLFTKTRALICVPSDITDVEQKAVEEIAYNAGAKEVYTIEKAIASAIGCGINIDSKEGTMILDIGGGTTEVAVLSMGGIVVSNSIKQGGTTMDKNIIEYIREKYNILVGDVTAEEIKTELGTAITIMAKDKIQVKGRNILTGLPDVLEVSTDDVSSAITDTLMEIIKLINVTIEKTPPELVSDITKNGIFVCGGGAYIKDIDRLITNMTGIPVTLAEAPTECTIKGIEKVIKNIELMRRTSRKK